METRASDKLNTSASIFRLSLAAFFLGLVLILPSGITAWFDGLRWAGNVFS